MSSFELIAFFAVAAFSGFALYFAIREFVRGLQSAGSNSSNENGDAKFDGKETYEKGQARHWYEVLGVAHSATMDEIKIGYRNAIAQYHPDKVAGLGIDLRLLAESRAKEINSAYDYARKLKQHR